jgi:hypothetical protein
MKRVVSIGFDPAAVDYSDPALPPGINAEKIHAGVKLALADIAGRGWPAEVCFIKPDETAVPTIERYVADNVYDCVVIGAGVRLPPSRLGCVRSGGQRRPPCRAASGHRFQHPS